MSIRIFAGFNLPRTSNSPTIYRPEEEPLSFRLAEFKRHGRGSIGQVTYPDRIRTAETAATFTGWGTYVPVDGSDIMGLRWSYIDDVPSDWAPDGEWPRRIGHEGYYMDADFDGGDMARGVILKLPAGRGYLYGWTMGAGMLASISSDRCDDINDAISWADDEARQAAENERDYRENHCHECDKHVDDCTCSDEDEDSNDSDNEAYTVLVDEHCVWVHACNIRDDGRRDSFFTRSLPIKQDYTGAPWVMFNDGHDLAAFAELTGLGMDSAETWDMQDDEPNVYPLHVIAALAERD